MTGRRGRIHNHNTYDLKEKKGYWKLTEEALDRTEWRNSFGIVTELSLIQTRYRLQNE